MSPFFYSRVVKGLSPAEKEAFVFRCNFARRNLSPDQRKEAHKKMKATAAKLREENPKKWTQAKVAAALGVARQTVSDWFTTNAGSGNASNGRAKAEDLLFDATVDARVKINPKTKPIIADRVDQGHIQAQIAADLGVAQQTISRIVRGERKKRVIAKEREEAAAKIEGDCGILNADFREAEIPAESVDLIFTDPPYAEESTALFADLATFGSSSRRTAG